MKDVTLITTFFDSPFHSNRAPYNEQLFLRLKDMFNVRIIRPISWVDITSSKLNLRKKEYFDGEWNGIPVQFPTFYFIPRYVLGFRGFMFWISVYATFNRMRTIPDIFFSSWAYPDAYATMKLAKKHNRPMVMSVLGSDINVLPNHPQMRSKIQEVIRFASAIFSPSAALRDLVIELGGDPQKVHVVYSGIDDKLFFSRNKLECEKELGIPQDRKRLIYVGNFKIAKGVMDYLSAVKKVSDSRRDFEALIIGKGEAESEILKFIADHQLESVVRVVGEVSHHDLNAWMNASDCLCLPSYNEGLPNVVLEALTCGIHVVATNVGGIPEAIVDPDAHLVNPGDIDQLAAYLDRALFDPDFETAASFKIPSYQQMAEKVYELSLEACKA